MVFGGTVLLIWIKLCIHPSVSMEEVREVGKVSSLEPEINSICMLIRKCVCRNKHRQFTVDCMFMAAGVFNS